MYLFRTDKEEQKTYILEIKDKRVKHIGYVDSDLILTDIDIPLEGRIFIGKGERGVLRALFPDDEKIEVYKNDELVAVFRKGSKVLETSRGKIPVLELSKKNLDKKLLEYGLTSAFSVGDKKVYSFEKDGEIACLIDTDSLGETMELFPLGVSDRIFKQELLKKLIQN